MYIPEAKAFKERHYKEKKITYSRLDRLRLKLILYKLSKALTKGEHRVMVNILSNEKIRFALEQKGYIFEEETYTACTDRVYTDTYIKI